MLIFRSVFIEHTHRLEKWDKSEDSPRTMAPKLLHYKDKVLLKRKWNKLEDTTYFIKQNFQRNSGDQKRFMVRREVL